MQKRENFPKFNSPEEEIRFLREEVRRRSEAANRSVGVEAQHQASEEDGSLYAGARGTESAKQVLSEYKEHQRATATLGAISPSKEPASLAEALSLSPEQHDEQIAALIRIAEDQGIAKALKEADKTGSPHIVDDLHRSLVRLISTGETPRGAQKNSRLWRVLNMTLYEVLLPESEVSGEKNERRSIKELLSSVEQFYLGMLSVAGEGGKAGEHFTIELALPHVGEEVSLYAAVPNTKRDLFEKQILSIFPGARVEVCLDDYNIFNERGATAASRGRFARSPALPLRLFAEFDYDPLNILVNAFSKIKKEGEGASIQFVIKPVGDKYVRKFKSAIPKLQKGVPTSKALRFPESVIGKAILVIDEVFGKKQVQPKPKEGEPPQAPPPVDTIALEQVGHKIASPIVAVNVRVVVSAGSRERADELRSDLESAFNQFENTQGNRLNWQRLKGGNLKKALKAFSFREFNKIHALPLSLRELTTIAHFPTGEVSASHQLKRAKAGSSPVPLDLSQSGIVLGVNRFRGESREVRVGDDDRLRHFYIIGQTGTGKSTLLKNMIIQDIERGAGVCMIDPHGTDILDILAAVPKERYEDVIYFDPSYTERPMGLNMLEYDEHFPEQKTFVVNELFNIFRKLYGAVPEAMGPAFEQYFRNATLLVIEDPETGNTLLDVSRVLADKRFRDLKLGRCKNPVVVQFWREIAEKAGGEAALANIVPYVTNKFDVFLANDVMRPIIAQAHSAFNFRKMMDRRSIFLVNLSKGRLGDINANLIGLILVGKILMAALSRVDSLGRDMPPFYLYLDEFQNISTDSIAIILSEARKYGLSLTMAHQFIAQLTEKIRDAVFGNVGSMCVFRVGAEDAGVLVKQFEPVFSAHDLMSLDNRNAYLKLLVNGRPSKPFNMETLSPATGEQAQIDSLKQLSYFNYGRARADIEREIAVKYK